MKIFRTCILTLAILLMVSAGILPLYAQSDGWQTALSNVEGGKTYYSVSFVTGGDIYLQALVDSGGLTLPEDPHKEGYKFLRWECEGQTVTDGMTVDHDLTINAVFEPIVLVDAVISYAFSINGSEVVFSAHSASLTLEDSPYTVISPEYTEVGEVKFWPDRRSVTISADELKAAASDGNTLHITVNYSPADLTYTLVSYVTALDGNGDVKVTEEPFSGNLGAEVTAQAETAFGTLIRVENKDLTHSGQTVNAYYQRKTVHLTFDTNGGEALPGPDVLYEQTVDLTQYTPVRKGYTFNGWTDIDGNPVSDTIILTADRTLTAQWQAANSAYSVVYYKETLSGSYEYAETVNDKSELTGTVVKVTADLAPSGLYTGYEPNTDMNDKSSVTITGDGRAVLPVYYKLKEYPFSFKNSDDTPYTSLDFTAKLGEDIASKWPGAPASDSDKKFGGWSNGSTTYITKRITVTEDMLSDTSYTAQWTDTNNQVTVNYYLQEPDRSYKLSDSLSQKVYTSGDLNAKQLTGFTYNKDKPESGCKNNVCNFYYDRDSYKFEYYDGSEKLSESSAILYGATVSPATPSEPQGLHFEGWYADAGLTAPYTATTMPNHNVALYARWKAQLTLKSDAGTETQDVIYGQTIEQPAAPVKAFHNFTGWYTEGGERWNFSAPVTKDVTLSAHYTENPHSYTVRYLAAENGEALHTDKAVTGVEVGELITEQAIRIAGWLAEEGESSLTVAEDPDKNVLIFRYVKAPETISYTVRYLRADDGTPVRQPVTRTVSGDKAVVYEFAPQIDGLYATQLFRSVTLTAGSNEITFYYNDYKTASLTVRMLDMDGDPLPGRKDESFALRIGESFDGHIDVEGYTWHHAAGLSVFTPTEADAGKSFEMELYYRKNLTLRPADLSKVYDGEPLVPEGTENVIADGLMEGHRIESVVFSGSQTEVGDSASVIESVTIGGPKSGNDYYAISCEEGILSVTEPVRVMKAFRRLSNVLRTTAATPVQTIADFNVNFNKDVEISTDEETGITSYKNGSDTLAELKDGVLTIFSGDITIKNDNPNVATTNRIVIAGDANVTLAGVNIEATDGPAIKIDPDKKCTIYLDDGTTNTLKGAEFYAGIEVGFKGNTENPTDSQKASLTIDGKDGKLIVTGGKESAGIGGNKKDDTLYYGDIFIKGGDITAIGGTCKDVGHTCGTAGIGSGDHSGGSGDSFKKKINGKYVTYWGTIQIDGGTITAQGQESGAGIGGGNHVDSGKIIINGGTINAQGASGIGSGLGSSTAEGGDCKKELCKGPGYYFADIEINGGNITAISGQLDPATGLGTGTGAGIGGGGYADARIIITGGTINAIGGPWTNSINQGGAGIGGGYLGHANITITGGDITAKGSTGAAGIGSGGSPNANENRGTNGKNGRKGEPLLNQTTVIISKNEDNGTEPTIKAYGGKYGAAGIGGGVGADTVSVQIFGGNITAIGAVSCNPNDPNEKDCHGMAGGAGIGGGIDGLVLANIVSQNFAVSGTASKYFVPSNLNIEIKGGNVTAIGGWGASAIGSGAEYAGKDSEDKDITAYKNDYTNEHTVINISDNAHIIAYADGTKFAIDTRLLQDDNTTISKNQTISGYVLQGTFVHEYNIDGINQNPEGLPTIQIFDAQTHESIRNLTGMADYNLANYRSFAVSVPKPGEYLVYTEADSIGSEGKKGRFFACSTYDNYYFKPGSETEPDPDRLDDVIRFKVETNKLSDNFYLYPVKSIVVRKNVKSPEGVNLSGMNQELTFNLKTKAEGQNGETFRSGTITISNGQAQNAAAFVNVPDNNYDVWEQAEIDSVISGSFGTMVLKEINQNRSFVENNGDRISDDLWIDTISFDNVYEVPPTPEPPDEPDKTDEPEETPTPTPVITVTTPTPTPTVITPTPTPSKTLYPIITPTATVAVPRETPTPPPTEPVPDNPPDPEYPELVFEAPSAFIDDYSVPLGLGEINMNAADCFE